jgi:hypothetical protein
LYSGAGSTQSVEFDMKRLLSLGLLLLMLSGGAAHAEAGDPLIPAEETEKAPFFDRIHLGFKTRISSYTNYLDNFFSNERADEEAADSQIRLIGSFELIEGKGLNFSPRVKARIKLPALKRRFNLLLDTESDDTTMAAQLPGSAASSKLNEDTRIALQLIQESRADFGLSHRVGINLKNGALNPWVRSQVRLVWQLSERDLFRMTQALLWEEVLGFGEETRLDYEHLFQQRALDRSRLLRITLKGLQAENSDGFEWSLPVELLTALPRQRAYAFGASISGVTKSSTGITNSSIYARYRQSFWRDWLYFDLTPQLEWPKANHRHTTARLNISLEVVF